MGLFEDNSAFGHKGETPLTPEEDALFEKVAKKVVERGMSVPAIIFLESMKPLNFIGSQTLIFFEPIIQTLFNLKDYNTFQTALEKRQSIEHLLLQIEKLDSVAMVRDKAIKKYMKAQKKSWKWYQRYLGIFPPRVKIPDEIINPPKIEKKKPEQLPPAL